MMVRLFFSISIFFWAPLFCHVSGRDDWKNAPEFAGVPSADDQGIVLDSHLISIPGVERSYNPSLVPWGEGYLLAVRQDIPHSACRVALSYISLWKLDSSFRVVEEGIRLKLLDEHSEDPRLFYVKDSLYLSYTHVRDPSGDWRADIAMAKIDQIMWNPIFVTSLGIPWSSNCEKNWVPFSVREADGEERLYFIYSFNPWQILRITHEEAGETKLCYKGVPNPQLTRWETRYGLIRGGTPAIRMSNGEYITLFHSSKGYNSYYVMGAITFEVQPFRLKKISPYPILFKGVYFPYRGYGKQKVLFPGGIVEATNEEGRDVFHVACGVNDTDLKIVTIDKEALLKSLVPIKGVTKK